MIEFWSDARADGGRGFLLYCDGELVGDADFREMNGDEAELAVLIGPRRRQASGLGACFVPMILALGFEELGLSSVYVAIRPRNEASLRLFARVGFTRDEGERARAYAEEDDDVCMVLTRAAFLGRHADIMRQIELRG